MRIWLRHRYATLGLAGLLAVGGCSSDATVGTPPDGSQQQQSSSAAAPAGLVETDVRVPDGLAAAPFDRPRRALVPSGWTMSVWARLPKPRLELWAPDGSLLVSRPSAGEVVRLPAGGGASPEPLLGGLSAPHGLAVVGSALYVAESNRVRAYDYDAGTASNARLVADGLPDDRSPDLGGAYAHALKSVAIGPDGAVYFSIGSTANVSPMDRTASPPRATIMRVPPGGGPANLALIRDVQTNADGRRLDCATLPPIEQSMGAHSAPLGLSFVDGTLPAPYARGALVGVHGSWNRRHPRAPEVSFYPWRDGGLGDQQTLVGGFQGANGDRWGRPVAAVVGPDGAIYVSDDDANAIYRVAPPGH